MWFMGTGMVDAMEGVSHEAHDVMLSVCRLFLPIIQCPETLAKGSSVQSTSPASIRALDLRLFPCVCLIPARRSFQGCTGPQRFLHGSSTADNLHPRIQQCRGFPAVGAALPRSSGHSGPRHPLLGHILVQHGANEVGVAPAAGASWKRTEWYPDRMLWYLNHLGLRR